MIDENSFSISNNSKENPERMILDPNELSALLADLSRYDDEHSLGTWMGRSLAGVIMNAPDEKGEPLSEEGARELQERIQTNLTLEDLASQHEPLLSSVGLGLESPNQEGNIDENEIYALGDIKIHLVDRDKYSSFLKTLSVEDITEDERKLLSMVVEKLRKQVMDWYDLNSPDDDLLELFSGMRNLIAEYERLDMGEDVVEMKRYLHYAGEGCLREYILARKHKLLGPIGKGFTLSTFHRDSSSERYLQRWEVNYFTVLETVGKNEQAAGFYNELLDYGKECIEYAEQELKNKERSYVPNIQVSIEEVKRRLDVLPRMQE